MQSPINDLQLHPLSDVQSKSIGDGTRVWQFCVILPGAKIGAGCNICSHVFIENDVIIGNNTTIKCGVQLWDGLRIGDDVFIGPNVAFTNDLFPRSKKYPASFLTTSIGSNASIGANATILPGISIGSGAMIGAGAVVTKNVPANAIIVGNPGVIVGYTGVEAFKVDSNTISSNSEDLSVIDLGVGGAKIYILPNISDMRGSLSVAEYEAHIPFAPRRFFWIFDVPSREIRGEHAHKELHQYLICVKGSVSIVLDDASSRVEFILDKPTRGVYIPPLVWGVQYKYSEDAVLLVVASDVYKADDYLRDYSDFVAFVAKAGRKS